MTTPPDSPPDQPAPPSPPNAPSAPGNTPEAEAEKTLEDKVVDVLRTVYDPEIPINIHELGLIYEVDVSDEGHVHVVMTLTSPNCPVAESLPAEVETKVKGIHGVTGVKLELTWEPPWGPDKMTEAARLQLGMV